MSTIESAIQHRDRYQTSLEKIRSNPALSDEAKQAKIAKLYLSLRNTLQALKEESKEEDAKQQRYVRQKLFGSFTQVDAAEAISFRDAVARAESGDARNARKLLEQATITGDRSLAKAVLSVAMNQGWGDVIDIYREEYPEESQTVDEAIEVLSPTRNRRREVNFARSMAFSAGAQPEELVGVNSELELHQLAQSPLASV